MTACRQPLIALLAIAVLHCWTAQLPAAEHTKDSLDTVKQNVTDNKAVLVDVREQSEWDAGHIEDAILLPLSEIKKGEQPESVPKDLIVYAHCGSGKRCLDAADRLKKLGYDVRPLKAGYEALLKAGFKKAGT